MTPERWNHSGAMSSAYGAKMVELSFDTTLATISDMENDDSPASRLKRAIYESGLNYNRLAKILETNRDTIRKIAEGRRELTREWALMFAPHVKVSAEALLFSERSVPIVGLLGSGSVVALFGELEQNQNERVKMPLGGTVNTVAIEIRGGSLSPMLNGWIAFYNDLKQPPTDGIMGETCAICLADGVIVVKKIFRGRTEGLYDLWEPNSEPMQDIAVVWASPITTYQRKIPA